MNNYTEFPDGAELVEDFYNETEYALNLAAKLGAVGLYLAGRAYQGYKYYKYLKSITVAVARRESIKAVSNKK